MVCKVDGTLTLRGSKIVKGDRRTLRQPIDGSESPGFNPILDRHVGKVLTVRDVAQADGYTLVLVWETALPIRGDWLQ